MSSILPNYRRGSSSIGNYREKKIYEGWVSQLKNSGFSEENAEVCAAWTLIMYHIKRPVLPDIIPDDQVEQLIYIFNQKELIAFIVCGILTVSSGEIMKAVKKASVYGVEITPLYKRYFEKNIKNPHLFILS